MKKFLVLGIGSPQADLVRHLFGKFDIHTCSYVAAGKARYDGDQFTLLDIVNEAGVADFVEKNEIDIVYSVGSDVAMPTATWVSEKLNLPTLVSHETAKICNLKHLFRNRLQGVYGAVSFHEMTAPNDVGNLSYPIIVKPADSQGQRGVRRVDSQDALPEAYHNAAIHSRTNTVIAEDYIEGQEISVNAFMQNGELLFSLPSDRVSWEHNGGGIIHKHILPCSIEVEAQENVDRLVREVCLALDIANGPAYFQIKMLGVEPKLIEVTPRLDGCHMWNLINHATGVNLLEMSISKLNGDDVKAVNCYDGSNWTLEFFCDSPGAIFNPERHSFRSDCVYHEYYYSTGDTISRMNGYKEKCGYQIYQD